MRSRVLVTEESCDFLDMACLYEYFVYLASLMFMVTFLSFTDIIVGVRVGHHRRGAWVDHGHAGGLQPAATHRQRAAGRQQPAQASRDPRVLPQAAGLAPRLPHRGQRPWLGQRREPLHGRAALLAAKGQGQGLRTVFCILSCVRGGQMLGDSDRTIGLKKERSLG